uniref:Uncharacterized protein n=1 Tax=Glossina palpalis gambiensis TaxID=67801 RepID=A0A1B0BCY5_9MUSC
MESFQTREHMRVYERLPQQFQEICFPITPSKSNQIRIFWFRICEQTALDYRLCIPLSIAYSINRSKLSTKLYAKRWSKLEIGLQLNSGASLSVINCLGSGCQRVSKNVI